MNTREAPGGTGRDLRLLAMAATLAVMTSALTSGLVLAPSRESTRAGLAPAARPSGTATPGSHEVTTCRTCPTAREGWHHVLTTALAASIAAVGGGDAERVAAVPDPEADVDGPPAGSGSGQE